MKFAWTMLVVASLVLAAGKVTCPIHDNSTPYFTGKSKSVDGHLMYLYHCVQGGGHDFWVRADRT